MPSITERSTGLPSADQLFEPYLTDFMAHLDRAGRTKSAVRNYAGPVKHLLLWMHETGTTFENLDDDALRRFRDHKCRCRRPKGKNVQLNVSRKYIIPRVRPFVQYLEEIGQVPNPCDFDSLKNLSVEFLSHLADQGLTRNTIKQYRGVCGHFIVWLRQHRIPNTSINDGVVERFVTHDCICEGKFLLRDARTSHYVFAVKRFVRYLVVRGIVPGTSPLDNSELLEELNDFRTWLRVNRGIQQCTIQRHVKLVAELIPDLGLDSTKYDAKAIRSALLRRFEAISRHEAQHTTVSLRMYLRYLASRGLCESSLIGAIPSVPRWRLSSLPRYMLSDDVEKVIESCDVTTHKGLRDRAVLLLLARLALRGGDVFNLRLEDIDWDNSHICVSGKSRRAVALPLPQDAGDALLSYIELVRPRVASDVVFLRAVPPYKPFASSGAISIIVREALKRTGIRNKKLRGGAYLLRHSAATSMLRSGATLDSISTLLRHRSVETTRIYAKVDTRMLDAVVQPWIGEVK